MEGRSLVPVFENRAHQTIYWEHEGNRAVRMGKWKLISKADKKDSFIWDRTNELVNRKGQLFDRKKTTEIARSRFSIRPRPGNGWDGRMGEADRYRAPSKLI